MVEIDMPITPIGPIAMHAFWPLAVRSVVPAGRLRDGLGFWARYSVFRHDVGPRMKDLGRAKVSPISAP